MKPFSFNPNEVDLKPIAEVIGARIKTPELRAKMIPMMEKDGNLSSVVLGDSERLGMGVGTWDVGQWVAEPIPVLFEEILVVVTGEMCAIIEGERYSAKAGEILYIPEGHLVRFGSDIGAKIVWITSPPSWAAFDIAYEAGKLKP